MPEGIIVVNGIPGSGKTTLAAPLAEGLGVPLIAKDAIKEALSDAVGGGLPTSALGGIALDVLWRIAALHAGVVLLESFWATGRDEDFLERGLGALGRPRGVEIWCHVPVDVAVERFRIRPRHAAHDDGDRVAELRSLAARARPITGFPVIEVDTTRPVDLRPLDGPLRSLLDLP